MNFQINTAIGGMNSDVDPINLRDDQYQYGLNISSRSSSMKTRPNFVPVDVDLPDGKFQGMGVFSLDSADRLVIVIAGNIYTYNLTTSVLTQVTDGSTVMSDTADRVWFCQAEQYFIVQDGINRPRILNFDGDNPDECRIAFRRAEGEPVNEIPIGTVMAYGHGRLAVALRELGGEAVAERFFAVGDIMLPTSPETVLQFTEVDYLSGGGAFSLPNELGLIHGMAFLKNQQSGNGLGSLIVFARNGASAFKINAQRETWQDFDISDVLFTGKNTGTFASEAVLPINNDLMYRSVDGVRTIGYMVAKMRGGAATPSNDTLSRVVDNELNLDSQENMQYCYAVENRNRILMLSQDNLVDDEHVYRSILALDASTLSIYGATSDPAFDGFWTGLNFTSLAVARIGGFYETFITDKQSGGSNNLYMVDEDEGAYQDGDGSSPVCRMYTKAFDLAPEEDRRTIAKIQFVEVWASKIIGSVSFKAYFRPYGHSLWLECPEGTVCFDPEGKPGFVHGMRFNVPKLACTENLKRNLNLSKMFEFCVEWTGEARIDSIVFEFIREDSGINASCDNTGECVKIDSNDGVELNNFEYAIA